MIESHQQPTRVRYAILALTVCVAVLLYLDRYCLGYVAPYVNESLRLTSSQTGFLLSAFFLTYAFGQIPGGWLADRFGTRLMLSSYLAIWSVLTGLIGLADGFLMLVLLRFGCGLFEAGAYPAAAGLIRRWVPYERRGLASGIVSLGGRIGGAVVPGLTGILIVVFTPLSSPSAISQDDLLDSRRLARAVLLEGEIDKQHVDFVTQIAPRLQSNLTPQARQALEDIASLPVGAEPATEKKAVLVQAVNDWIKQPDLFQGINLAPVKHKLNDQARALHNDSDTSGNERKYTRLNRYLLELAFAGSIRQILGDGWQPVLAIYGAVGVLVALVFFAFYRNSPREHFLTNQAEAELAEAHEIATEAETPPIPARVVWKSMLTNISLWANSIVQFGTNFGWIFLGNNLALYLFEVHEVPEGSTRGLMVSLPFLVSLPMMLVGGWWTDWMTRKYGQRIGRCFPIASTRFITGAAFVVCFFLRDPWAIVIVLCVMSIINDMGIPALWGYNLDVGRRNVGLVLGWGNMWGNLGAFVSPNVLFWLRDQFGDKKAGYDAIFLTCAGVFIFIGFVSLFIDATKQIGVEKPAK